MALTFNASTITVSGVGVPLNGIAWPSGQFALGQPGAELCAFLSSANATFGFGLEAHRFQTEWIPCGTTEFHGASGQLPNIGHELEVFVGDFLMRGTVTHSDYTTSIGGTVVNIVFEDKRHGLRRVKIHTEDLGEDAPSGVVSIARAYRVNNGLTDINGDPSDPLIREYERILQFGGTYTQVLEAIDLHFNEGKAWIPASELPTAQQIEQNIGGGADAVRWQFNLSPLDEAMTRMLQDAGYDWYWNMDAGKVNLISRKAVFDLEENDLLDIVSEFGSGSGLNETKQLGFGKDVVPDPTRFRVIGGHQEGVVNSDILSPIDGLDTSALDGTLVFAKVWDRIGIGFYDAGGFYRTYIPGEKELQLALAGIEQWSYFKLYQTAPESNDPEGYDLPADAGSVAAQHPSFQSRFDPVMPLAGLADGLAESGVRVISNRRDAEHNWTLAFYQRVHSHASRHYGRSYVLENFVFNEASGLFKPIDAAWANVDNQVQGYTLSPSGSVATSGIFLENYEINRDLGPISPFVTDDFRVRAHCKLPVNTIYGPLGNAVPAGFGNWTEDAPPFNPNGDGSHYIPVDLVVVGQKVINPRSSELYGFETFPEGTLWCQLPINAGPSGGLISDSVITDLGTLLTINNKLTSSGVRDIINPALVLNVYDCLSGVAIPVQARSRYGQGYPSEWVLGNKHYERDEDVQLDDQFVPWAFSPDGSQTSLSVMTERAIRRVQGKVVPLSSSRYADFSQVGLPLLSFDSFANQSIGPLGFYGETSHGVNEVNIAFGLDGFSTRYKVQSYFPKFGKDAPRGERVRAELNGILNPIDFVDITLLSQGVDGGGSPNLPGDPFPPPPLVSDDQRAVRVTITDVNNVFTLSSTAGNEEDERYRGTDVHGYNKPPTALDSGNEDFQLGAICIDGFLNIDDEALYHTDEFELPGGNAVLRYFTQGRPFGNGTIVEVERTNNTNYDVTIVDPTAAANGIERAIFDVEVLNGSVALGDKTTLAVQGDGPVSPGASDGTIFINGTVQDAAGVTPVEITFVSNVGTDIALALCRELGLGPDGKYDIGSGQSFVNVVPVPFRELAASGDRGFLTTPTAVPSGGFGKTAAVSFVEIVRPALRRFA
jgi:hypothetical protein